MLSKQKLKEKTKVKKQTWEARLSLGAVTLDRAWKKVYNGKGQEC